MRGSFEQDNADVDRDVAQCAAISKNRLEKVMERSSTAKARSNVSTGQGAKPCSALDGCGLKVKDVLFCHVLFVFSSS